MIFSIPMKTIVRIRNKVVELEKLSALSSDPISCYEAIFKYGKKKYRNIAAIKLGTSFYVGDLVEKDYQKSAFWYKRADTCCNILL